MDGTRHAQDSLEQYRLLTARETGLEFGRGSYAAVVEVDYKGLRCAGKKVHRVLYESQVDNLVRRFEEECRLLSQLRHPHVVQFLGIYFEVDTNAPVLVMEFLPATLTQCLDRYGVMPEEINCSILQDVAVGLRYLHDRRDPVIHRDLSANNVLLTADMRAKISDLGMAKIVDANPNRKSTMTKTPGTQCYMPPETMVPKPRYSIEVDIFSYGVMMLHVLSGRWPFPGEAVRVNPRHPNNPYGLIGVTEFDRREEYVNLVGNEHPLMTLIQGCLSNSPSHRPTSSEVHQRVSAVAAEHPPSFTNRVEMMDRIKVLGEEKERVLVEKDRAVAEKNTEIAEIRTEKDTVSRENERILSELEETRSTIDSLHKSHSIEVEALQIEHADMKAENEQLHATIKSVIAKKDVAITERDRSVIELTETQSTIDSLHKSQSIEVEALQIENADMKAENEHLHATITAKEKECKSGKTELIQRYEKRLETVKKEKQAMEEEHRRVKQVMEERHLSDTQVLEQQHTLQLNAMEDEHRAVKQAMEDEHRRVKQAMEDEHRTVKQAMEQRHQAMEERHLSDRQAREQQHTLQLNAMEDEHHTVKQAMEQRHQAQLESKVSKLSAKDALISSKCSTIRSLQTKLGQALGTSSSKENLSTFSPGVKLISTECANVPDAVAHLDQGVVIGGDVYVGVTHEKNVFKYCINKNNWSTLPLAPVKYARIGCLYKKVQIIGGRRLPSNEVTADIHEFDEASQQWVRSTSIPPMQTARSSATVVSWSSPPALIVCGGNDQQHQPMTVVEVYHSRTSQWHTLNALPLPRDYMTHTVIVNMLYLIGGTEGSTVSTYKKTVISTSIPQLVDACLHPSQFQWQSLFIPSVPYYKSPAASLGGCLLVVGGTKDVTIPPKPKSVVSSVHAYCPFTSSWVLVGELPQPLYACITATLPTGELLVIGGITPSGVIRSTTYKCSLSVPMEQ